MNNNYELVKQGFNKDANERYYLFECKPQKRTIICRSKYDIPFATYNVSLDKHYFLIITVDHLLKKAYMGEAISSIVNSDKILAMAYNFNGNSPGIHCGGPDYADMSFRKADFPKFLSMFWNKYGKNIC